MKKMLSILPLAIILLTTSCKNGDRKVSSTTENVSEKTANNNNAGDGDVSNNDERINNAGEAKRPKGKMSYVVDGTSITIDENTVQCMYVGMNSTMAQSVISGGSQCMIVHMGIPKVGDVEIKSIANMPSVGIQVIIGGVQYNNKKPSDAKFTLTKVTADGKNYYVAGTFNGKLTSIDGNKTIAVTNGLFESAYL